MRLRYLTDLSQLPQLGEKERHRLEGVAQRYAFRVNDYYLGLIDWEDPADPIRQLVIPREEELIQWGALDASDEASNTPIRGVQHKYRDTVLLLCNEVCGAYCRYCFRKRLFMNDNDEVSLDITQGLDYIRSHREVTNVLLTGGDPLILSTRRLREILTAIRKIDHVRIIRIGTKMPAFNPWRLLDDPDLQSLLRELHVPNRRIYLMAHFDHPRELTEPALQGLQRFRECGVSVVNQCPLVRGVNDSADVLHDLFRKLAYNGIPQYYLFQGRPTAGNEPYEVPLVEGYRLFQEAIHRCSGLGKRGRFVMSHRSGKIEVVGVDAQHLYLRYHRAKNPQDEGRMLVAQRDENAYWLDDLQIVKGLGSAPAPDRESRPLQRPGFAIA